MGEGGARVFLAWAPEGLYGAVEVADATLKQKDPRSFWAGDCLELFVDTRDAKRARRYEPGDHQFWLVPLVDEKRAYVGQWKRGNETAATRYDVAGIKTAARRRVRHRVPAAGVGTEGIRPEGGRAAGHQPERDGQGREVRARSVLARLEDRRRARSS